MNRFTAFAGRALAAPDEQPSMAAGEQELAGQFMPLHLVGDPGDPDCIPPLRHARLERKLDAVNELSQCFLRRLARRPLIADADRQFVPCQVGGSSRVAIARMRDRVVGQSRDGIDGRRSQLLRHAALQPRSDNRGGTLDVQTAAQCASRKKDGTLGSSASTLVLSPERGSKLARSHLVERLDQIELNILDGRTVDPTPQRGDGYRIKSPQPAGIDGNLADSGRWPQLQRRLSRCPRRQA